MDLDKSGGGGNLHFIAIANMSNMLYSSIFADILIWIFDSGAPLLINKQIMAAIAQCNKNLFGFLFGALVVGSAFQFWYLLLDIASSAIDNFINKTLAF